MATEISRCFTFLPVALIRVAIVNCCKWFVLIRLNKPTYHQNVSRIFGFSLLLAIVARWSRKGSHFKLLLSCDKLQRTNAPLRSQLLLPLIDSWALGLNAVGIEKTVNWKTTQDNNNNNNTNNNNNKWIHKYFTRRPPINESPLKI